MKRIPIGKLAGGVAMLVGVPLLTFVAVVVLPTFARDDSIMALVILLAMTSFFGIPGALCTYFGARLLRDVTRANIKYAIGSVSFVIAQFIAVEFSAYAPAWLTDPDGVSLDILVATLVAVPIYAITCRAIMNREGIPTRGYREFISKWVIAVVAFQIWGLGTDLARTHIDLTIDSSIFPILLGLSPVFIAWGFYRVAVWYVERGRTTSPDPITN